MDIIDFISQLLGILTVIAQVGIFAILLSLLFKSKQFFKKSIKFISRNTLASSLIISLTATLGSLFYSEIALYPPCKLCWYQRIFMYPLVIILGYGFITKDKSSLKYSLLLSIPGGLIALYHYFMQRGFVPSGVCSVVGYSQSCSKEFVMQFNYITIPLMSLTAFTAIFLLCLVGIKKSKK